MSTTNYTVGIGEGDKISSKVLKPPGGETHDIFGTGGDSHGDVNISRRNRNYNKSNVFGADATDSSQMQDSPKQKHGNANRSNIFGGGEDENEEDLKQRKVRDHLKSNIFGDDEEPATNGATRRLAASNSLGGNPITGEGYLNGNSNGEAKENGQPVTRVRNPPGGHSSKLW